MTTASLGSVSSGRDSALRIVWREVLLPVLVMSVLILVVQIAVLLFSEKGGAPSGFDSLSQIRPQDVTNNVLVLLQSKVFYLWLGSWILNVFLARLPGLPGRILPPLLFGISLLACWELLVVSLDIPMVILPAPSQIWAAMTSSVPILWSDFVQTVMKSVLPGYVMGCGAAFLTALAIDRSPFLQRGLIPVANLAAALPIIGIAPIMVMWFGFDWQSKAAVVVLMCFFPMLVNTMEGLRASDHMQRDLMRTYAASYGQTLIKLRIPAAAPFIFNGLKICTTLALIGAIVAEFFGTPIVGMGFRISTEVGRLALDMVWAEIAVAALAGSAFYGIVTLLEKATTFWHPSQRH